MYGNPVKSPFPSHSTGRRGAAVNNQHMARRRNGGGGEEEVPCTLSNFYLMHSFLPCVPLTPHLFSVRLILLRFLVLSVPLLSLLRTWQMIAKRKVELDASLAQLSFETCGRFCFAGASYYCSPGSSSSKTSIACHDRLRSSGVQSVQDNKRASVTPLSTHTCHVNMWWFICGILHRRCVSLMHFIPS